MFAAAYGDPSGPGPRRVPARRPPNGTSAAQHCAQDDENLWRPAGANEAQGPIGGAQMFNPDNACRAGRMNEFAASNRDSDVRGAWRRRAEEDQISRLDRCRRNRLSHLELFRNGARDEQSALRKDVGNEAGTIEPGRIASSVAVRRPSERQRCANEGCPLGIARRTRHHRWRRALGGRRRTRKRTRHGAR